MLLLLQKDKKEEFLFFYKKILFLYKIKIYYLIFHKKIIVFLKIQSGPCVLQLMQDPGYGSRSLTDRAIPGPGLPYLQKSSAGGRHWLRPCHERGGLCALLCRRLP